MSDFAIFVCGVIITLVAGMGVITSQVFCGYTKFVKQDSVEVEDDTIKQAV